MITIDKSIFENALSGYMHKYYGCGIYLIVYTDDKTGKKPNVRAPKH